MATVRQPAVAGLFYPDNQGALEGMVDGFLGAAPDADPAPKALIAPHAGLHFCGEVAASAFRPVTKARDTIRRVIMLGPSHRVAFQGIAASRADYFATPLDEVAVDRASLERLLMLPQVHALEEAHTLEHSLEVHLPFLQRVLDEFIVVPLVVGQVEPGQVDEVIEALWGGPETLIAVSSDLSHFHDYQTARELDEATSRAIEALEPERIDHDRACGRDPINGLLRVAREYELQARTVDLRSSGDSGGPRGRVVGYGAYLFH